MSMPGGSEWLLIVIALLLLFGGKKIPELMRGLGKGVREFKDAKENVKQEYEQGINDQSKDADRQKISAKQRGFEQATAN